MDRAEQAENSFRSGYLCAPSVFSVFSSELGLDKDIALRIATGFGAGISRQSKTCGAVTGAIMAIGLKFGRDSSNEKEVQEITYQIVKDFIEEFRTDNGSIECQELTGYLLANTVELERAKESGIFRDLCPKLVHSAVEILESIFASGFYENRHIAK